MIFVGRAFTARQAPREGAPYINSSELRCNVFEVSLIARVTVHGLTQTAGGREKFDVRKGTAYTLGELRR